MPKADSAISEQPFRVRLLFLAGTQVQPLCFRSRLPTELSLPASRGGLPKFCLTEPNDLPSQALPCLPRELVLRFAQLWSPYWWIFQGSLKPWVRYHLSLVPGFLSAAPGHCRIPVSTLISVSELELLTKWTYLTLCFTSVFHQVVSMGYQELVWSGNRNENQEKSLFSHRARLWSI